MDHDEQARRFFASWSLSFGEMCDGFHEFLAPDCIWDQRPMCRTTGPASAVRFLRVSRRALGLRTIGVDLVSLAVNGDMVHSARIDHLYRADGGLIASAPVAGVMTFRDGRIAHWKEYFDPTVLAATAVRSTVLHALARIAGRSRR
jgi:limonene-1,2-epoxide hydrolase